MKKGELILVLLSMVMFLSACVQGPTYVSKQKAFPALYEERPLSIVVLPPINMTSAADAKEYYATTIAEPLSYAGYYIYPIEVTNDILKNEGLYDTESSEGLPPEKYKQFFGADAVMYIKILKWDTSYFVLGGNVTVAVDCLLKSTTTGRDLWKYRGSIVVDTSGNSNNSGGGIAGLVAKLIVTAIATATTDYVPIAKQVNLITISSMPYGKYNPNFDKDRDAQIILQQQEASK
jgi:hypothetical protein